MTGSERLRIPHDGCVVIGDGRKALVLRNHGHPLAPDLHVEDVFHSAPNPPTREQGSDRPPRVVQGSRHSAIEQTDWHDLGEHRFLESVVSALQRMEASIAALALVAPPKALADLRRGLPDRLRKAVFAEIDKDLTKHTVPEIQDLLCGETD
ncbi:MAG: host attachment protein [Thermoleophilia bacterium]|nr:host attachment protein [Thermoleophilia bacterium]